MMIFKNYGVQPTFIDKSLHNSQEMKGSYDKAK